MKSLSLKWQGLAPVIEIDNFRIFSPDHTQIIFSAGEVDTKINILGSFWKGHVLLNYFHINQFNLRFEKNAQGKWQAVNLMPFLNLFSESSSASSSEYFSGAYQIAAENFTIEFKDLFPRALPVKYFKTNLVIDEKEHQPQIKLKSLEIKNSDMDITGQAGLLNHKFNFNLKYDFSASIVSHLDNYLPRIFLGAGFRDWLLQSIKHVDSIQGEAVWENKLFSAQLETKNLDLNYDPKWPPVEHINAELIFKHKSFNAKINTAVLSGVELKNLDLSIPELGHKDILTIQGTAVSDARNLLDFIAKSPLKKSIGKYFEQVDWKGNVNLYLNMTIPLGDSTAQAAVQGELKFSQNLMTLFKKLNFKNANGHVFFTEKGLSGKNFTAVLTAENLPVAVDIFPGRYVVRYKQWRVNVLARDRDAYRLDIVHPGAVGYLDLPNDFSRRGIFGEFVYFHEENNNNNNNNKNNLNISPEKIPPLNIIIKDFQYHHKKFGQVKFKTFPARGGLILKTFQTKLGSTQVNMTGEWRNNHTCFVKGELVTKDIAQTFAQWNLTQSIQSQAVHINYSLDWRGSLYAPEIKTLAGNININIGSGRLLNIASTAKTDFGKLLTLLSFQSISKKLRLDFSDFKNAGLNFDHITGSFQLNRGIAATKDFILEGPLANIAMTGSVNMLNQTYNLKLIVTPHLTSSLPVIATLAGGPVAGAAAWAAEKILNPLLNEMTSDHYLITGSLDNPVISRS